MAGTSRVTLYYNHFGELAAALVPRARIVVEKTAKEARDIAMLSMHGPKSGLWYKKSLTGEPHQASAPGEPPAIDTGSLVSSFEVVMDPTEPKATINVFAEYAEILEFGGAKMAERPFLRPALAEVQPSFESSMNMLFLMPGTTEIVVERAPLEGGR